MQEFLTLLSKTTLFCGIPDAELRVLLTSLCPIQRSYHAGELILLAGYEEREIGIVLNGQIEAERTTLSGEALPIAQMGAGSIFGDVLSGSHTVSPVTVAAKTDCVVLSIAHARLLSSLPSNPAAAKLLQNLIATISDKYFALSGRLDLLMTHRLRDRIV
ncbi:MAG: cyclic nucleotide-binding domain-containing protein, partial [Pygmaiobacter sp.]